MAAAPVHLQRGTLKRVDTAFKGFFSRVKRGQTPGFPRYRGKGWYDTLEWQQFRGITFWHGRLKSKAFGSIRVHLHRPLPKNGTITAVKITHDYKGWSVCFVVSVPTPGTKTVNSARCVGVDVGLTSLATLSTGEQIPSLRAARKAERSLRVAQRALSRCKHGSQGRTKARAVVRRVHTKVRNSRRTYAHQQTARLVKRYDLIAIEDLNIKGLARTRLAKSVHDAGWSTLFQILSYKAERAGTTLIRVDPRHTSQDCARCQTRVPKKLHERTHRCPSCGLVEDRDVNAALNILRKAVVGLRERNVGHRSLRAPGNISAVSN